MTTRKKLIEVALPLEAINEEGSRRKRKAPAGYPTTLHKWWAQRPVAAARAVIFAHSILDRLGFDRLLAKALPAGGRLDASQALGVLVRNIALNDRQPVYTHVEWARQVESALVRLKPAQADLLNDDRVGRALDRLFDADRAALMTELVLRTLRDFTVDVDQLHNDSTTLTLTGDYTGADGKELRGKPTLHVTYGHNKDHRPDLKPLLFVLTVSADGAVPIHYRAMDGNTNDSMTHIDTWETLRTVARRPDFLS